MSSSDDRFRWGCAGALFVLLGLCFAMSFLGCAHTTPCPALPDVPDVVEVPVYVPVVVEPPDAVERPICPKDDHERCAELIVEYTQRLEAWIDEMVARLKDHNEGVDGD